jgi:hypothetical protein
LKLFFNSRQHTKGVLTSASAILGARKTVSMSLRRDAEVVVRTFVASPGPCCPLPLR